MSQNKIKVMNRRLDKSATVLADSFVDFKRRAATALEMSGWLNVRLERSDMSVQACDWSPMILFIDKSLTLFIAGRNY